MKIQHKVRAQRRKHERVLRNAGKHYQNLCREFEIHLFDESTSYSYNDLLALFDKQWKIICMHFERSGFLLNRSSFYNEYKPLESL